VELDVAVERATVFEAFAAHLALEHEQ